MRHRTLTSCPDCDGTGFLTYYDSVPYGMGNTLMPTYELCANCLGRDKCPLCSHQHDEGWADS